MGRRKTGRLSGTPARKRQTCVRSDFDKIEQWAKRHRRKIMVGEFGISIYADLASQVRWTSLVRQEAEAGQMIWILWNFFSQDKLGSLYNQPTGARRQPILEALLPSRNNP